MKDVTSKNDTINVAINCEVVKLSDYREITLSVDCLVVFKLLNLIILIRMLHIGNKFIKSLFRQQSML